MSFDYSYKNWYLIKKIVERDVSQSKKFVDSIAYALSDTTYLFGF